MEVTSFTSRRPAAVSLPTFSLPPPNSDIPRAGDGLSPSLSSVHTGSSQGSQTASNMQYTYGGPVHGGWPASNGSSYHVNSGGAGSGGGGGGGGGHPSLGQNGYGSRPSVYNPPPSMPYAGQRSSQSPATGGEGFAAPAYEQVHQSFQAPLSNNTTPGGHDSHGAMPGTMLAGHGSTQPPTPSSAPAHVDSYTHSRPSVTTSNYTSSAPHHPSSYSSYTTQSPTSHSPTSSGPLPRSLGPLSSQGPPPSMAPPYRYQPYHQLPTMAGPVMSNIHQPGSQMSMIPGIVSSYGHPHAMMYTHAQPTPQSERPFKCDQCVQSFSRNHDLKRHKRIHLAVKPFPCSYCSKSFSRKDALKRHRLVKGCENKVNNENNTGGDNAHQSTRTSETDEDGGAPRRSP